jgi:hypothetical protein
MKKIFVTMCVALLCMGQGASFCIQQRCEQVVTR